LKGEFSIQHKVIHGAASGVAFDDTGERVSITEPELFRDDLLEPAPKLDPVQLLSLLIIGSHSPTEIGSRALLLAFDCRCDGAPRNYRELGVALGCSHVTARARLTRLKADLFAEFAKLHPPPYQAGHG
jgi:hypothetical protein